MNKNEAGLIFGTFLAVIHAVWSLFVAIIPGPLQSFLNWVLSLHCLEPFMQITQFNFMNAVILVILVFVMGYIMGFGFMTIVEFIKKKFK